MGENIECLVSEKNVVRSLPPKHWNASKPLKVFAHGFRDTVNGPNTVFLKGKKYSIKIFP